MISAFGVEHGEFEKAYKKLRPKLAAGLEDEGVKEHRTFNQKLRRHAVQARMTAGGQGQMMARRTPEARAKMANEQYQGKRTLPGTRLEVLRQNKVGAHGIYDAIGRLNRASRVLP